MLEKLFNNNEINKALIMEDTEFICDFLNLIIKDMDDNFKKDHEEIMETIVRRINDIRNRTIDIK